MNNFELIDDYLTNRLNEQERKSFEQQIASDPTLKADVDLQQEIVQGLKAARIAELKAMLNKIPIATPTIYFSPLRIAAGLIGAAALATGLYFYSEKNGNFNPNQISSSLVDSIRQSEQTTSEVQVDSIVNDLKQDIKVDKKVKSSESKRDNAPVDENAKPAIDLLDPTSDLTESNNNDKAPETTVTKGATIAIASIEVDINSAERKYKSHYQFANGKLILYGSFDNGLYEIIEVNGQNSRSLFLYYKTGYSLLDESKKEVTLLKKITDPVLIQKLNTFRSN